MRQGEAILLALETALKSINGVDVSRNKAVPDRVHPGGTIILWDGAGDLEEYTIGAPTPYLWTWTATIEVLTQATTQEHRDSAFDQLCQQIGDVITGDRTLGGRCDWLDATPPKVSELPVLGAPSFKGGEIAVTFIYSTANPTG